MKIKDSVELPEVAQKVEYTDFADASILSVYFEGFGGLFGIFDPGARATLIQLDEMREKAMSYDYSSNEVFFMDYRILGEPVIDFRTTNRQQPDGLRDINSQRVDRTAQVG